MRSCRKIVLRIVWIVASCLAANAQTTATIPVTVSASGTAIVGGGSIPLTGSGAVSPYGNVTVSGSIGDNGGAGVLSLTFTLSTGDSFLASDPAGDITQLTATAATVVGTATVSGGTGKFSGVTGSFAYTLQGAGSDPTMKTWSIEGIGNFTSSTPLTPCSVQLNTSSLSLMALPSMLKPQGGVLLEAAQNGCSVSPVTFSASATTADGQNWLSVTPASGTATPSIPFTVTADASSLMPGVYQGTVTVTQGSSTFPLAVMLTVSDAQNLLTLSQSGLQFQVAAGPVALPSQSIAVSETGSGTLSYSAAAQTLSGGSWLTVTPASGSVTPTSSGTVSVGVNSSALAPGDYYGLVQFSANSAANTPQSTEVTLRVLPSTTNPEPLISPTGLIFVASPASSSPAQTLQIFNASNQAIMINSTVSYQQGKGWLTVSAGGAVPSGKSLALNVQVPPLNLSPGIYNATLSIQTSLDNTLHPIAITLILLSSSSGQAVSRGTRVASGSCTPTQLLPVFTLLGNSFQTPAGWPVSLQAQVVDDCGNSLNSGTVVASFSTGDPPLSMVSLGGGQWAGTWQPHGNAGGQATVTLNASSLMPVLAGSAMISGMLSANPAVPSLDPGGIVSAASYQTPVALGSFVSIYGSNLASQAAAATTLPFPMSLSGTQVILGGETLPLAFAAGGQINAIVPYDLQPNAAQQIIVQQNNSYSLPQSVLLSTAEPAVFTQNQSGTGPGTIVILKPNGTEFETSPTAPASAGDVLIIYCSGLGPVSPPVPAGSAASATQLSNTVNPVTVTVAGQ
ncbi:MAG TPA: hypothetical protein VME17_17715, partial [Bryobacteraceae bacterium]|nr:hypothetical protein [Bryobacteraceae bacterium]